MRYDIAIPKYVRKLATLHFPGSTTLGYLVIQLNGCQAEILLEIDSRVVSFVFPIRNRANYRLIRGQFQGNHYDLSIPYESGLINYLGGCLAEGTVFIDIGANAGWFTLIASRLVGNTGFVYSFEPDPGNFQALCDNVYRHNTITNCFVLPIALSNRQQIISLTRPRFDDGTGLFMSNDGKNRVLCARLDQVLRNLPDRPIHVKIDVEAAEFLAVDGFGDIMKRITSFAVEVSGQSMERFGIPYADLFTLMRNNGFSSSRLNKDGSLTVIDAPETGDIVFQRGFAIG